MLYRRTRIVGATPSAVAGNASPTVISRRGKFVRTPIEQFDCLNFI